MKKTILTTIMLCALFSSLWAKKTIAILYFENNSLDKAAEMEPLKKGLADMLITEFDKIEQFQVVERNQLEKMLKEMELGMTGVVDQSSAQQVGKMLGAQTLLLGSYMNMFDGKMRIDVRIVEVETGLTLKAEEVTGKPKNLHKMITQLVVKVLKGLDVKITKADAKRLSTVENTSFDAAMYYAKGLAFEDAGDKKNAKKMYQKALKKNAKFNKAKERLNAL